MKNTDIKKDMGLSFISKFLKNNFFVHDENTIHFLKCWPLPFGEIRNGKKHFELRKNDRNYCVDDYLVLFEYDSNSKEYSGNFVICNVLYITHGGNFNLPKEMCIMSIKKLVSSTSLRF